MMGKHELNAWAFHCEIEQSTWLKPRSDKNLAHHIAALHELLHPQKPDRARELRLAIDFFGGLPVFLDFGSEGSYTAVSRTVAAPGGHV